MGPAIGIQVLSKLSLGVKVMPEWDEASRTIRLPPVLLKAAVVSDVDAVELTKLWLVTTVGTGPPSMTDRLAGAVGVGT